MKLYNDNMMMRTEMHYALQTVKQLYKPNEKHPIVYKPISLKIGDVNNY